MRSYQVFTDYIVIPSSSRKRIFTSLSFYYKVILRFFDISRHSTFYSHNIDIYPRLLATLNSRLSSSWNMRHFFKFLQDVWHNDWRSWEDLVRLTVETITKLPLKVNSHKDSSEVQEPSEAEVDRPSHVTLLTMLHLLSYYRFPVPPFKDSPAGYDQSTIFQLFVFMTDLVKPMFLPFFRYVAEAKRLVCASFEKLNTHSV